MITVKCATILIVLASIFQVDCYHYNSTGSFNRLPRATKSCTIDIKKKMNGDSTFESWPLVLDRSYNFKAVSSTREIKMTGGEKFMLSCPGSQKINGHSTWSGTFVCDDKENIKVDGQTTAKSFYTFKCETIPQSENNFEKNLGGRSSLYNIGFQVTPQKYITLIKINYDGSGSSFTKHSMGSETQINEPHQKLKRPDFLQGAHPIAGLKAIYNQPTVKKHLVSMLGQETADKWMKDDFDKGHLAANGDFAFASQQKATFFYLNCIPQFHRLNSINWLYAEKAARKLATENGKIDVVTGTVGQLLIADEPGYSHSIYLDPSKKVSVPWIFWKVIEINSSPQYIFIGLNYPTHKDFAQNQARINGFCDACPSKVFTPLTDPTKGVVLCCMHDNSMRRKALWDYGIRYVNFG